MLRIQNIFIYMINYKSFHLLCFLYLFDLSTFKHLLFFLLFPNLILLIISLHILNNLVILGIKLRAKFFKLPAQIIFVQLWFNQNTSFIICLLKHISQHCHWMQLLWNLIICLLIFLFFHFMLFFIYFNLERLLLLFWNCFW